MLFWWGPFVHSSFRYWLWLTVSLNVISSFGFVHPTSFEKSCYWFEVLINFSIFMFYVADNRYKKVMLFYEIMVQRFKKYLWKLSCFSEGDTSAFLRMSVACTHGTLQEKKLTQIFSRGKSSNGDAYQDKLLKCIFWSH